MLVLKDDTIKGQRDTISRKKAVIDSLQRKNDTIDACIKLLKSQKKHSSNKHKNEMKYSQWATGLATFFSLGGAAIENWYYLDKIEHRYLTAQTVTEALNYHIKYEKHQTLRNAALGFSAVSAILFATQYYRFITGTDDHNLDCTSYLINNSDFLISYYLDDNVFKFSFTGTIPGIF